MQSTITGSVVDIRNRTIFPARVEVQEDRIAAIVPDPFAPRDRFILPGFIDAHVHIESSMLPPHEFGRIAVKHGTVATISDPHEIANVLGLQGIVFMIEDAKRTPLKIFFGAPPCVPATPFETAGARITPDDIEKLCHNRSVWYLSEVMNYPGVINRDPDLMAKISIAKTHGLPIDGHAPGLLGTQLDAYLAAHITTDHECSTYEEALEKLQKGMRIIIREGSAAKNYEALKDLISTHSQYLMFCSDDKHPDDLLAGHIQILAARAVADGHDVFDVLRIACLNPVDHYRLPVGTLRVGEPADMIVVDNLQTFHVCETYINGEKVFPKELPPIASYSFDLNHFDVRPKLPGDFVIRSQKGGKMQVIVAHDGELITTKALQTGTAINGHIASNVSQDVLKITVVNRYADVPPAVAFVKGFGLKSGAIASTVAHDSHNIIAVGADDASLCQAVNLLIDAKGGICCVSDEETIVLPLTIAGLMSTKSAQEVAKQYELVTLAAKNLGCAFHSPFMTLSFMALLVIPHLKLSDKGLFDGDSFQFTPLEVE
jgi:adenine deaminase